MNKNLFLVGLFCLLLAGCGISAYRDPQPGIAWKDRYGDYTPQGTRVDHPCSRTTGKCHEPQYF